MVLQVLLGDQAHADIAECFRWWAIHRSTEQADRWHDVCERAIDSLALKATTCARASENDSFPFELRQLNFGVGRRPTHRVLFTIRPDSVLVLRVQHFAQKTLTIDDV
jgi:plasmid stabilization system protein ParE